MTKITGANYNKQGVGTVFPTEMGGWSSQTIPFLERDVKFSFTLLW